MNSFFIFALAVVSAANAQLCSQLALDAGFNTDVLTPGLYGSSLLGLPRTLSNTCTCQKTVVRPKIVSVVKDIPSLRRIVQNIATPVIEKQLYNAQPATLGLGLNAPCGVIGNGLNAPLGVIGNGLNAPCGVIGNGLNAPLGVIGNDLNAPCGVIGNGLFGGLYGNAVVGGSGLFGSNILANGLYGNGIISNNCNTDLVAPCA